MENNKFHPSAKKSYLKIILLGIILLLTVNYLGIIISFPREQLFLIVFVITLALLVIVTGTKMNITIQLTENSLSLNTGLMSTNSITIPYNKITETNIRRTFLDNIMGVARVEIDTPGEDTAPLIIEDLLIANANDIVNRINSNK